MRSFTKSIRHLALATAFAAGTVLSSGLFARVEAAEAKVTFVLINDIYKFEPEGKRGGMAKVGAVIRAERAKGGNVVVSHGGDFLSPSVMSGFDKGAHMIELMNITPVDIFVPGNHEWDHGPEVFLKRMTELKGQKLAANLRNGKNEVVDGFADTMMRDFGGVKVGFIGGVLPETPTMSTVGDYKFGPSVKTMQDKARELRSAGADFVVAVVHFDSSDNRKLVETGAVDLILSGHNHDLTVFFNGKTGLVESKEEGEYVTAVDVDITTKEEDGRKVTKWWPNFRITDTANVQPDPEVQVVVERLKADLNKEFDVPLGALGVEFDSRKASVRSQETAMGNLVADAMKAAVGADIAVTNGGGIRGNRLYPAGHKLTRRDVMTELPFGNKTVLAEISGADLLASLEHGVANIEDQAGKMPQVSGLSFVVDKAKPAGSRVSDVKVNGQPLDREAKYRLATNDFMKRGGDGYKLFASARPLMGDKDGKLIANDVMVYVREKGDVKTGVEGRIIMK